MQRRRETTSHHLRRGGFTMLELLVVGMIGIVLLISVANAWRWFARGAHATQVSSQLTKELKLAADAMAQDFGPAVGARTTDGINVQFDLDGNNDGVAQWGGADNIVEYAIDFANVVRRHPTSGLEFPMATH